MCCSSSSRVAWLLLPVISPHSPETSSTPAIGHPIQENRGLYQASTEQRMLPSIKHTPTIRLSPSITAPVRTAVQSG